VCPAMVLGCALLITACSSDAVHKCEFTACGGDPVGSWYGEWICPDKGFTSGIGGVDDEPACDGAVFVEDVAFDLALQLDPYDTFVYNGTTLVYWQMTWTPGCLNALNSQRLTTEQVTQICADYSSELTNDPASTFSSGRCDMDSDGVCHCRAMQAGTINERGGYYAAGHKIYMDSGYKLEYCVKGDVLEIRDNRAALGPMVERLRLH
jgi:hypothetical protein